MPAALRVAAKAVVLVAGWIVASTPAAMAVVLWRSYGGSIHVPELATVAAGHVMNAGLTIGLAAATASMTEHPSTAAIVTLSVTVGTWILNFIAAVQGGLWERMARYTPTAMVAEFQHGLIRLDVVVAAVTLVVSGLALAAVWIRLGVPVRRRAAESLAVVAVATVLISAGALATTSWDTSESRRNSFSRADEAALATAGPAEHRGAYRRRKIRDAWTWNTGRCRSFDASVRTLWSVTSQQRRSGCSSRRARVTGRSGTTSRDGRP